MLKTLSAKEVAELILANKGDIDLSHRKLQKLLYYCQSMALTQEGIPLFEERIEAWEFGPVCPSIYHIWKQYGYTSLPKVEINVEKYTREATNIVLVILATFGNLSQEHLIEMSHIDTPWSKVYVKSQNNEVKHQDMLEYFSTFSDTEEYNDYISNRQKYASLIDSRKSYLQELVNLGDNWLSSESIAPNTESISLASKILTSSKSILNNTRKMNIPGLIMGPLPKGGISIELVKNDTNKLYVTIHHENFVEIDIEKDGLFTEYEETYTDAFNRFETCFKEFA